MKKIIKKKISSYGDGGTTASNRSMSYERLVQNGKVVLSPKFVGNWTPHDIQSNWSTVPDSVGTIPVLKGQAWQELQNVDPNAKPSYVQPIPDVNYKADGRVYNSDIPSTTFSAKFGDGGTFHTNPAHAGWCTPLSNPHCTGKRRQFALNAKNHFNKMADGGMLGGAEDTMNDPMQDPEMTKKSSPMGGSGAGISINTLPLLQGADALVNMMYNQRVHQSEARMLHDQLMPLTAPVNSKGFDDTVSLGNGGKVPVIKKGTTRANVIQQGFFPDNGTSVQNHNAINDYQYAESLRQADSLLKTPDAWQVPYTVNQYNQAGLSDPESNAYRMAILKQTSNAIIPQFGSGGDVNDNGTGLRHIWNQFTNWLGNKKGSKSLDHGNSAALYQKFTNETGLPMSSDHVAAVQQDFMDNRDELRPKGKLSKVDGWAGSITSTYKYPDGLPNVPSQGDNMMSTPDVNTPEMTPLSVPITRKNVPRGVSYEHLTNSLGKESYSPVFHGDWSKQDVKNYWSKLPDKIGTVPVDKGDDWMSVWKGVHQDTKAPDWAPTTAMSQGGMIKKKYGDGGQTDNQYGADPSNANVVVEGGEFAQFPDGHTKDITGDKHSDPSGGEYKDYPDGTRIYSEKIKADNRFSSDVLGTKISKKMSISDLAKKFNTEDEDKTLTSRTADSIAKRTASIMKEAKTAKLNDIFQYQEMMKNPRQHLGLDDRGIPQDMSQGAPQAGEGMQLGDFSPYDFTQRQEQGDAMPDIPLANSTYDEHVLSSPNNVPDPSKVLGNVNYSTQPITKKNKDKNGLHLGDYAPEIMGAIQGMGKFPITLNKYIPELLPEAPTMDISNQIDNNYAQTKAALSNSSGNISVDSARNAQLISNMYDANNQVYSQKHNADMSAKFQRDSANTQITNQANLTNLNQADQFWNKVTQRKANQDETMRNVVSSAYAKAKAIQMEKEQLKVASQLYPDYKYKQGEGFSYVSDPNGNKFMVPNGVLKGNGTGNFQPNDGKRTTITKKYKDGTTIRQREDDGS